MQPGIPKESAALSFTQTLRQVSSEYPQPRRPAPGMLLQHTQSKGLKGHRKSTIHTLHGFPASPSQTKEWEEIQRSLKEFTASSLYQQERTAKFQAYDLDWPEPASLSCFPSMGARPVWGLNGTQSRAVIHSFLHITAYGDIKIHLKKVFWVFGKRLKGKTDSDAAQQMLVFTHERFYSLQIDFSRCKVKDTWGYLNNQSFSIHAQEKHQSLLQTVIIW